MRVTETLLDIGPDFGDLPLPALPPGHEWASARLRLRAEPVVSLVPRLQAPTSGDVPWVSMEWGAPRPITALQIAWSGAPPAFVVARTAIGGVWFAPLPPGRAHPRTFQPIFSFPGGRAPSFPPVTAGALLLEFRASDPFAHERGEPDEARATASRVTLTALNQVTDLAVSIGDAPVLARKGRVSELDLDLLATLRAAHPGAALQLRAAAAATLALTWDTRAVPLPQGPPREPLSRQVAPFERVRWSHPATGTIVALAARLAWKVEAERLLLAPPGPPDLTLAQAVFPGQDAAQALGVTADAIRGVDLWIAASVPTTGTLALVPDKDGLPGGAPLAETTWQLAPNEARWISLAPPPRARGPLWLVCRAQGGEALLARAALPGPLPPARQRRRGGPWAPVDDPESLPHLHLRLRASDPAPAVPSVTLRRGDAALTLPGGDAWALSDAQCATLGARGELTLEVTSPGAGVVTLAAWELRLAAAP